MSDSAFFFSSIIDGAHTYILDGYPTQLHTYRLPFLSAGCSSTPHGNKIMVRSGPSREQAHPSAWDSILPTTAHHLFFKTSSVGVPAQSHNSHCPKHVPPFVPSLLFEHSVHHPRTLSPISHLSQRRNLYV
ncbi:hypothetical protein BDW75DRAFT_211284 [Aspergillus navahoensis]